MGASPEAGSWAGRPGSPWKSTCVAEFPIVFLNWPQFLLPQDFLGAVVHPSSPALEVPISSLRLLSYSCPRQSLALFWAVVTFKALNQVSLPGIVLHGPGQLPLEPSHFSSCSWPPGYSLSRGAPSSYSLHLHSFRGPIFSPDLMPTSPRPLDLSRT